MAIYIVYADCLKKAYNYVNINVKV